MNAAAAKTAHPNTTGSFIMRAVTSSAGAKVVMSITGLLLLGFVIAHLVGNLQVFGGYEGINAYGAFLKGSAGILWTTRIGLLAVVVIHILSAVRLSRNNKAARPQPYAVKKYRAASWYSRYMLVSGIVVLAFIVFHLLHFTVGLVQPEYFSFQDPHQRHDVYRMMVMGFSVPWVVLVYIVSMVLLGFHLAHGIWSALQSLGLWGTRWTPFWLQAGKVLAWLIVIGFIAIPIGLWLGVGVDKQALQEQAAISHKR